MIENWVIDILEENCQRYNQFDFIVNDPISIPHQYILNQDVEIAGFFTAILSWGQRKTILNNAKKLMQLFGNAPYDFMLNHSEKDLIALQHFKHRTFNYTDLLYFISFFKDYYQKNDYLENAFYAEDEFGCCSVEKGLVQFHELFFGLPDFPTRTKKHISTPLKKSTCKRLNMFLRWMVRADENQVDFGIWKRIPMSELYIPFDVHVERFARKLQLIKREKKDWETVKELTNNLKLIDPNDPIRFDYALFGMGIAEKNNYF
ncbi:MAG: TIGR02757 family protein [Bacteroidetes bacterium]|nr:TIGR02757 family protein [Bacteroidota bacterium]